MQFDIFFDNFEGSSRVKGWPHCVGSHTIKTSKTSRIANIYLIMHREHAPIEKLGNSEFQLKIKDTKS